MGRIKEAGTVTTCKCIEKYPSAAWLGLSASETEAAGSLFIINITAANSQQDSAPPFTIISNVNAFETLKEKEAGEQVAFIQSLASQLIKHNLYRFTHFELVTF